MTTESRRESDSMGAMNVPSTALWGASTARAVHNFPISGQSIHPRIIHALARIKACAARINQDRGLLTDAQANAIDRAAREIFDGKHDDQFPIDVFQTGSGTSTNMNVNEVIANRAAQLAGIALDAHKDTKPVHPNDHVNLGQSSNDSFPSALHVAAAEAIHLELIPALDSLQVALELKAHAFWEVLKLGRTHLMDATPVRLGQEFRGYARQIDLAVVRIRKAFNSLLELPLGGTAVGTGLNAPAGFAAETIQLLARETGIPFRESPDHFETQGSRDAMVEAHGQLNTVATSLHKIANDLRLLSSGPQSGLGEIKLPATQPGSSIMPGKVNPVIPEAVCMVAARVFGNQTTITFCGAHGHLELNTYMPIMGQCLLESILLIAKAAHVLETRCITGIEADTERCKQSIERSMAMVTGLAPRIGYDRASALAKESVSTGRTIRELCLAKHEELGLSVEEISQLLDPATMAG